MKDKLVTMLEALEDENQLGATTALMVIANDIQELSESVEMNEDTPLITPEELGSLTQKQANQLFSIALLGTGEIVQKM